MHPNRNKFDTKKKEIIMNMKSKNILFVSAALILSFDSNAISTDDDFFGDSTESTEIQSRSAIIKGRSNSTSAQERMPLARTATVSDLPELRLNYTHLSLEELLGEASKVLDSKAPVLSKSKSVGNLGSQKRKNDNPLEAERDESPQVPLSQNTDNDIYPGRNLEPFKDSSSPCGLNLGLIEEQQIEDRKNQIAFGPFTDVMNLRTSKATLTRFVAQCDSIKSEIQQMEKTRMKKALKAERINALQRELDKRLGLIAALNKGIRKVTIKIMGGFGLSLEQINAIPPR